MKTVGDLIGVDFPLLWHEAVAIVQEVASQVSPDRGISADTDLVFNGDGTITVRGARQGDVPAVTALGRLLQRLLPEDAPIALRALASENSGGQPAHATVDAFTAALTFFERPGRAAHLRDIAARLENFKPQPSPEEELDRLRKKVIETPEPPAAPAAAKRSLHPGYAAGGALVLVAVIVGARLPVDSLLAMIVSGAAPAAAGSPNAATATAADPNADPSEDPSTADTASAGTDSPARHPIAEARRGPAASHRRDSAVASDGVRQVVTTLPARADNFVASAPLEVQPSAAPAAQVRDAAPRVEAAKVYSTEDATVTPAALVHPQLPSEPEPGPTTGYFDLTVDESGRVVTVRLVSPARRYQERLLVSAAKAWRFRPALLGGRPVKYRMRVPINLPESQ